MRHRDTQTPETRPRYLIGIDLGTTHTVVAFADTQARERDIQVFEIEQLVNPGEVSQRPLLPSVRYHPGIDELSAADICLPWARSERDTPLAVVGVLARSLGAKTRGRTIASAKSWLSHPGVDPSAAILPWGAPDDVLKISPVDASASYLDHVRCAWNAQFPDFPLERQDIVVTVPASFDEAARTLTIEAARRGGLASIRLLEEPQAVCYDWLRRHRHALTEALGDTRLLLVCDVGGGTTDLTLIKVDSGDKDPVLTRVAVGDHLMLGGDNVDLALAHSAEKRLVAGGKRLAPGDLSQLVEQCRVAKERLLAADGPDRATITLLGAGGKVIGGARSTELTRDEVREVALEGFFPVSDFSDLPSRKRSGVVEFGLPYASEPAISKHIAAFLNQHARVARDALGEQAKNSVPDAVLLNGGVFRSEVMKQRLLDVLTHWRGDVPRHLDNSHPELAVAYGAVAYAMARRGEHVKIGGGAARSYFLVVDGDGTEHARGVCILPRGSEEGTEIVLESRSFSLRLGEPVRFHLTSSSADTVYRPGDLVEMDADGFHFLPPLAAALGKETLDGTSEVTVKIAAALTDLGTLNLQCVSVADPSKRWDIEFQLRKGGVDDRLATTESLSPKFVDAASAIRLVFGPKSKDVNPKAVKQLRATLERILGKRSEWDSPMLRELFGALLEGVKFRRRSAEHERLWLSLTGFCLRPGLGMALDEWRVEQVWKMYPQGLQFVNEAQNWSEWWTLWRRIAGGLEPGAQHRIWKDIAKFIDPASGRHGKVATLLKQRGYEDIVRLAAVLEHLKVAEKTQLGEWLLHRLQKPGEPVQSWWAVGRIGARVPFHGGAHNVVPPATAADWLERILRLDWKKSPHAAFAASLIARMSGDRARDIDAALRERILEQLRQSKSPASWSALVEAVVELQEADEKRIYGEALPPGLKLIG